MPLEYYRGNREMDVERFVVGEFATNCYIVKTGKLVLVIDPGAQADVIIGYFDKKKTRPDLILNTHGHFDHIGAVSRLLEKYDIKFYIDAEDAEIIADPAKNGSSIFSENNLSLTTYSIIDGPAAEYLKKNGVHIIKAPGHSPGSIVIKIDGCLFTGDLLFRGSIGRTDLIGGDVSEMKKSLEKIRGMDSSLKVYPGHGPESCMEYEKENNYFLCQNAVI